MEKCFDSQMPKPSPPPPPSGPALPSLYLQGRNHQSPPPPQRVHAYLPLPQNRFFYPWLGATPSPNTDRTSPPASQPWQSMLPSLAESKGNDRAPDESTPLHFQSNGSQDAPRTLCRPFPRSPLASIHPYLRPPPCERFCLDSPSPLAPPEYSPNPLAPQDPATRSAFLVSPSRPAPPPPKEPPTEI